MVKRSIVGVLLVAVGLCAGCQKVPKRQPVGQPKAYVVEPVKETRQYALWSCQDKREDGGVYVARGYEFSDGSTVALYGAFSMIHYPRAKCDRVVK